MAVRARPNIDRGQDNQCHCARPRPEGCREALLTGQPLYFGFSGHACHSTGSCMAAVQMQVLQTDAHLSADCLSACVGLYPSPSVCLSVYLSPSIALSLSLSVRLSVSHSRSLLSLFLIHSLSVTFSHFLSHRERKREREKAKLRGQALFMLCLLWKT